jgi:hypothetical protein
MSLEKVKTLDFTYVSEKQNEWREYKNESLKKIKYRPSTFLNIPFNQQ